MSEQDLSAKLKDLKQELFNLRFQHAINQLDNPHKIADVKKDIARLHERVSNLRDDWQWKLSHDLCRKYDLICIEDLNIDGMKRLWGRKVSELAFSGFVSKLEQTASKYGCEIRKVDRYYASSKTCGHCGYVNKELTLRKRRWTCPECGAVLDRDMNAAENILRQGIASSGSPRKTKVTLRKGR